MDKRFLTFLIVLIMIIFVAGSFPMVTFAENFDYSSKINELSERNEQLSKENKELRILLDNINKESIRKEDIIKSLEDKEGNLIATAEHTINRVNFWLTFLGIFISVLGLFSVIVWLLKMTVLYGSLLKRIKYIRNTSMNLDLLS
ncbi:hypothetical protein EHE19_001820 [Ruminiclostridium herbifermentans]|uniref:Septum formation initiator n=1 Tax=Ruminiclostridium herbifermentans TaxID=2488810 RepID=A0A4U7J758_9FIRM|nr:hypothetical protein [Ruminiclostridium herbifermentans]QNU67303.1 hypothetical protein EHE19_001820 [Ruminiclostridium herbifermentans]